MVPLEVNHNPLGPKAQPTLELNIVTCEKPPLALIKSPETAVQVLPPLVVTFRVLFPWDGKPASPLLLVPARAIQACMGETTAMLATSPGPLDTLVKVTPPSRERQISW